MTTEHTTPEVTDIPEDADLEWLLGEDDEDEPEEDGPDLAELLGLDD